MKTILLLFVASVAVAETRITDVACGALDARSGKVEVSYTVTMDEGDPPTVLRGMVVDHVTGKALADATLSGARTPLKAGSFRVVWHLVQDVPNLPASRVVLRLRAEPILEKQEDVVEVVEPEPTDLLYYCTFDNAAAISSPAAGPSGTFLGGSFAPGKAGNALRVEQNTPAMETLLPKGALGSEGCMEFWAKIESDRPFYADSDPLFLSLFDERGAVTLLQFSANNGFARGGLGGAVASWPFGTLPHFSSAMEYAGTLGPDWAGWHHYALSWKADGFPDGTRVKVFIDGAAQTVYGGVDDDKVPARLADFVHHSYALGIPWNRSRVDNRHSNKPFWIDELKIWKTAKTEFEESAKIKPVVEMATTPMPQNPGKAIYLIVDLSGGPAVDKYPYEIRTGVPDSGWTDEYKTTKLVLRLIEPGSLTMGYHYGETPQSRDLFLRNVTIEKPFFIGVFEVTQRQWELVMGNRPSFFRRDAYYATRPVESVPYTQVRGMSEDDVMSPDSFLGTFERKTGLNMDIPMSAQWEYACRAGTTTALNNNRNLTSTIDDPAANEVCRYWSTAGKDDRPSQDSGLRFGTAIVGSYKPNAWGLYDMHGNVWEWCREWLEYTPPSDVRSVEWPIPSQKGGLRTIRGGSWRDDSYMPRSANFAAISPTDIFNNMGFRISLDVPPDMLPMIGGMED